MTLPLIRRSIVTNLMLITLQTLAVFTTIYVLTGGGPGNKSQTTPIYMYEQAFKFYDLGYGTAMALVLLLVGGLFSRDLPQSRQVGERDGDRSRNPAVARVPLAI